MIFLASQIVQPEIVQGSCQCGFSCLVSQLGVKDFSRCWFLSPGSSYCERQGHVNATLTFPPCLLPPTIPFDLGKDSLVGFSKTLKVVSASATLFKTELSMLRYVILIFFSFLAITFVLWASTIPMDNLMTAYKEQTSCPLRIRAICHVFRGS